MATPRDLNKNAQNKDAAAAAEDAKAKANADAAQDDDAADTADDGETYIVYREPITDPDTGAASFKEHRVKQSDWADYEKEHNL
jgi:hypothetical protein